MHTRRGVEGTHTQIEIGSDISTKLSFLFLIVNVYIYMAHALSLSCFQLPVANYVQMTESIDRTFSKCNFCTTECDWVHVRTAVWTML